MLGFLRTSFGYHVIVDRVDGSTERVAMRVRVMRTRICDGVTACARSYPVRGCEGRWEYLSDKGAWRKLPRWVEAEINAYWRRRADAEIHREKERQKRAWLDTAPPMSTRYW